MQRSNEKLKIINIGRYTTEHKCSTKNRKGTRVLLTEKPIKYRQQNEIQAVKTYEVFSNKHTVKSTRHVVVMKSYRETFAVNRRTDKTMVKRKKKEKNINNGQQNTTQKT